MSNVITVSVKDLKFTPSGGMDLFFNERGFDYAETQVDGHKVMVERYENVAGLAPGVIYSPRLSCGVPGKVELTDLPEGSRQLR